MGVCVTGIIYLVICASPSAFFVLAVLISIILNLYAFFLILSYKFRFNVYMCC